MEVLLLSFANSREHPLPSLAGEYAALNKTLSPRVLRQHFLAWSVSHATLDDIAYYLTLFRDRLSLFLYSGHAGRDRLLTESGDARAGGIAHLLGQCKNLKVVVLNGCSTGGQVAALHAAGVPLVIATSAPVADEIATRFSEQLFQALETGLNIGEAFEQGIGVALSHKDLAVARGVFNLTPETADQPLWGIFSNPGKPDAMDWKLPLQTAKSNALLPEPNEQLLETLYDTFAQHNQRVRELHEAGALLDERKEEIVAALLKALPAPISEHVRKLVAPSQPGAAAGWDSAGPLRLAQLAQTYQICMDFLLYVLMAQMWENILRKNDGWRPTPTLQTEFKAFLRLNANERRDCDYFSVLRLLRDSLEGAGAAPFVEEVTRLREEFMGNEAVKNACFFLETLRRQTDSAGALEMPELCARAEQSLALIFGKLGFLGRYLLATVRNIDVLKFRHTGEAQFEHMVVKWHGTLGFYEKEFRRQSDFMDNRSVVLLRLGDGVRNQFLNLSPFILDENTFEAVPDTSLSKLYFFAWRAQERLFYKYVNDPDLDVIDLDDDEFYDKKKKTTKFQMAKTQFEAFYEAVFEEKPNAAAL